MTSTDDSALSTARSMGTGMQRFADAYDRLRPDLLVLLGDRFEMHAAACAAVPFQIPIAHIHGGEVTTGAMDDALRHSISKLSHLHFVSTDEYGCRLVCMGAHPSDVVVSGAPGLDAIADTKRLSRGDLSRRLGIPLDASPLAVTFHPETRSQVSAAEQVKPLLAALEAQNRPLVISRPNADPGNAEIVRMWEAFRERYTGATVFSNNLGSQVYFSLLAESAAMIGNSSSGIIEAASFELPVVNIGERQCGRLRPVNVIDVANNAESISRGLERALSNSFRQSVVGRANPYGDGRATERIVDRLRSQVLGPTLVNRPFYDVDLSVPRYAEGA